MMSVEQQNPMVQMPQVVEQTMAQYQQPIQETRDLPTQVSHAASMLCRKRLFARRVFHIDIPRLQGVSANIGIMQQQQEEALRLVEQQRMAASMRTVAMSSDIVTPQPSGPSMQSGALMSAVPVPDLQETPSDMQMQFIQEIDGELARTTTFA